MGRKNLTPPRRIGCHSRESGNPYGTCSIDGRLDLEVGAPSYAQWIPAFAGMTSGWGCRSREGGNPYGACSIEERLGFGAGYPDYAQWIPAFAGMTGWGAGPGWPTGWPRARAIGPPRATRGMGWLIFYEGMPVEAVSMRLPRHALPRRGSPRLATGLAPGKLAAVPGNAIKCSVDQAWHKYGPRLPSDQGLASGAASSGSTQYRVTLNSVKDLLCGIWRDNIRVHPAHSSLTQRRLGM